MFKRNIERMGVFLFMVTLFIMGGCDYLDDTMRKIGLRNDKRLDGKYGIIQYGDDFYYIERGRVAERYVFVDKIAPAYYTTNTLIVIEYVIAKNKLKNPLLETSSATYSNILTPLMNSPTLNKVVLLTNEIREGYIYVYDIIK